MQSLNALFIVGGPGSGKDFLLRTIQEDMSNDIVEMPLDKLYKAIKEHENLPELKNNPPVIINGTAEDYNQVLLTKRVMEAVGYETAMVYVFTTNEASQERNNVRISNRAKTITEDVRQTKYDASFMNMMKFKDDFSKFVLFDNSADLRMVNEEQKAEIVSWLIELQETIEKFFIKELTLDEQIEGLVLEGDKDRSPYNIHKDLLDTANSLRSGKNKTMGMHGYTAHNNHVPDQVKKNITKSTPPKGGGLADYFSHNRVKTGLGLKEEFKTKLFRRAKPPSTPMSTNVGAPYGATQVQGTAQTAVTEQVIKEVYEDWGMEGGYGIYEGRAVSLNKPFRKTLNDDQNYSVYFTDETGIIARKDFNKQVYLEEQHNDGIRKDLESIGVKKYTPKGWGGEKENKYHADHKPEDLHKVLVKHGYKMVTHYKMTGEPFPKHHSYEKSTPYMNHHVELRHEGGKVKHITFENHGQH